MTNNNVDIENDNLTVKILGLHGSQDHLWNGGHENNEKPKIGISINYSNYYKFTIFTIMLARELICAVLSTIAKQLVLS